VDISTIRWADRVPPPATAAAQLVKGEHVGRPRRVHRAVVEDDTIDPTKCMPFRSRILSHPNAANLHPDRHTMTGSAAYGPGAAEDGCARSCGIAPWGLGVYLSFHLNARSAPRAHPWARRSYNRRRNDARPSPCAESASRARGVGRGTESVM